IRGSKVIAVIRVGPLPSREARKTDRNPMNPFTQLQLERLQHQTRRLFLRNGLAGAGAYWLASQGLPVGASPAAATQRDAAQSLAPRAAHLAPRDKRVLFLHMAGGPSQLEMISYKPTLAKL